MRISFREVATVLSCCHCLLLQWVLFSPGGVQVANVGRVFERTYKPSGGKAPAPIGRSCCFNITVTSFFSRVASIID